MEIQTPRPGLWRAIPANALTYCNMGAGTLVAWWAASEFDLGWAAAEWAASLGVDGGLMAFLGTTERRTMGIGLMVIVWMFGLACDLFDGWVARKMGVSGDQGAWLDSMADLMSCGLAPAFVGLALMKEWSLAAKEASLLSVGSGWPLLLLAAAAWRLARYAGAHSQSGSHSGDNGLDFMGIPAPLAALYWVGLLAAWGLNSGSGSAWALWMSGLVGSTLLPLGMVLRWPQMGVKSWGNNRGVDRIRAGWIALACGAMVMGGAWGPLVVLISYPLTGAILQRWA